MKAPADESPVDIRAVLDFIDSNHASPRDIRDTVAHLSWKNQMEIVVSQVMKY